MMIENIFKYSRTILDQQVFIADSDRGFFVTYDSEYFTTYNIKQKRR
jgi:hypothetical protein